MASAGDQLQPGRGPDPIGEPAGGPDCEGVVTGAGEDQHGNGVRRPSDAGSSYAAGPGKNVDTTVSGVVAHKPVIVATSRSGGVGGEQVTSRPPPSGRAAGGAGPLRHDGGHPRQPGDERTEPRPEGQPDRGGKHAGPVEGIRRGGREGDADHPPDEEPRAVLQQRQDRHATP